MQDNRTRLGVELAEARDRVVQDSRALEEVHVLLKKADERRRLEPEEARRWDRVLEHLETSLDQIKVRRSLSESRVIALELDYRTQFGEVPAMQEPAEAPAAHKAAGGDEPWSHTLAHVSKLNLEQASQLQSRIDAGEIEDSELAAGLTLANQLRPEAAAAESQQEPRKQLLLRAAIDRISKREFDKMTLDEINMVLACHSLLTSRLEPTSRDQRLKRILDGAIKILRKRKNEMAGD